MLRDDILMIEDITDFVKEQHQLVLSKDLDKLLVPEEKPILLQDDELGKRLRNKMKTITLYRPVGEKELILIAESGFK